MSIPISGNTYPAKEQLKALGGKWNADQKAWMVPDDKADEANKLVAGAPVKTPNSSRPKRRRFGGGRYLCPACGNPADGGPGAPGYECGEPCG